MMSPRLVCLAIHSVTYKYFAQGEMHAFRTLRSPCHQRLPCHQWPQRPPCPHWPPCPIGRRVPLAAVSPIGARSANGTAGSPNAAAVSPNGLRVTHHWVSLTAPASLNAAVSLITGMSLTAAASPTAPNGCCAIGIVTYKMQFDSEICAIYTLQTSQTRLASPRYASPRLVTRRGKPGGASSREPRGEPTAPGY